jgi:ribosomal protein S18 acetylase RimI-like enzyme
MNVTHPQPRTAVRDARESERPHVESVVRRAYSEYEIAMDPAAWEALERAVDAGLRASGAAECIVAERGGELIGCVFLYPPAADPYAGATAPARASEVRLLSVVPEARGAGVGRLLIHECIRRARARGERELGLHTSASMRAAVRLYETMGFERHPVGDFRPPGAELVEAYRLRIGEAGDTGAGRHGTAP